MASAGTAYVDVEAKLDSFASDIDAAVSAIDSQTITVEAEVDGAQSAIDSLEGSDVLVGVEADTSDAEGEIDSLEGTDVTVSVSPEGIEDTQSQIDGLTESTSMLGDAAQGALGGMGGLSGAAGGAAGALGGTALAGAGAAAGLFEFAQAAIDAESATQRFNFVTGDMSAELSSIDVGGLSGDIGELALQLGSSDEAMLNATASFVSFAESTGASGDEIIQASDNINALALRAVALNPSLGDAGAVAERMTNALARGGRATTQFGIGLTSAEINARAMANTGKQNTSELTQFEKAAAGAEIAVEKLGDTMGTDFQEGSENARTEWNRMTEQLGEAAETVGSTMLPAIENITNAVTELASGLANLSPRDWLSGLWDLSGGLIADGVTDLWGAVTGSDNEIQATGKLIGELPPALLETAGAATDAATAQDEFAAAQERARQAVINTLPTLGGIISKVDAAGEAFGVLNASSDPQVVIDNLGLALFAWQDFQNNIAAIDDWGPRIAGALQELGPDVAGGLTSALAEGNAATIIELDNLLAQVEAKGGDISAVLTGFATNGMAGAVAAVGDAAPGMEGAGAEAGAAGAAGIDAGLAGSEADRIGDMTGRTFAFGVRLGIIAGKEGISAQADSAISSAGSTFAADQRGYQIGKAWADGVTRGMATAPEPRAAGGPVTSSGSYLVGEQGPELFVPRTSGTIIPAPATAAMGTAKGSTYNVTVNAAGGTNGHELARLITDELRKLERAGQ